MAKISTTQRTAIRIRQRSAVIGFSSKRKEFLRNIALIGSTSKLSKQIRALENYYDINSPKRGELVCIDEMLFSGYANSSSSVQFEVGYKRQVYRFGMNLFGGVIRWVAGPESKIICQPKEFHWKVRRIHGPKPQFNGSISYINFEMQRRIVNFSTDRGNLKTLINS